VLAAGQPVAHREQRADPLAGRHPDDPAAARSISGVIRSTTSKSGGFGAPATGGSTYRPSTSVAITSSAAPTRFTTVADRLSLSPKRISSVATVSFSFTIGTTPSSISVWKVWRALRKRSRSWSPLRVSRICATRRPRRAKRLR
jgi:hypothetical protein